MTRSLPTNPSLENLKKQAKSLLQQCHAANADALGRIRESHPQFESVTDEPLPKLDLNLADCQLVLAREFGFASWPELKQAIEAAQTRPPAPDVTPQLIEKFLVAALLYYQEEYRTDIELANQMLREQPRLANANIWCAAATGNVSAVKKMLEADSSLVDQKGGPYEMTPLLYLCYSRVVSDSDSHDAMATATLLLDRGADANAHYFTHGTYRFTCVTGAIGEGENGVAMCPPHPQAMQLATLLLERGANPNDGQGLYNSMFSGGTHWIQLMLDHGLNKDDLINWSERDGQSTLDYLLAHACKKNMVDRVKLLLQHGADPNALDWYDKRPCYEAALQNGNTQVVELLAEHGAKRLEPKSDKQRFYNACMAGDAEAVDSIRAANRDAKVQSWISGSKDHLSRAVGAGKIDVVRFMLGLGFSIGDALFDAAWHGRMEMAKLLVEHGARARQRNPQHDVTPVAYADRAGHTDIVDFLMEQDVDVFDAIRFDRTDRLMTILDEDPEALERPLGEYSKKSDRKKQTPLVFAVLWEKPAAVKVLLERGADAEQKYERKSLVEVAKEKGFAEVVEVLRSWAKP